jgi:hypothetical protein
MVGCPILTSISKEEPKNLPKNSYLLIIFTIRANDLCLSREKLVDE